VLDESVEGDLILAQINIEDEMVQSMNEQEESVKDENCSDDDDDSFAGIERINETMSE
jgi:hypothetical protein